EVQQAGERVALFNGKMEELTGRQNVVTDNACRKLESVLSERLADMKEKVGQAADEYFQELGLVRERNSSMEENIIASLSHEMDVKVQGIRNCVDACQQDINVRIEGLDKLKTEIWALEGKVQALKEQGTGRLEDCMKAYEADAVRSFKEKMDILTGLTDGFREKEQLLSDVQEKLDRLDRSMDWLARTETRLNEAVRKGEETVSLLGGLGVRSAAPEHVQDVAADTAVTEPPEPSDMPVSGNVQNRTEMVKQLVQRGWNNRKISETLGISEGEVELIRDFNCGT
ncbi:MAG: hypothetical protein MJ215_04580, partial [Spirochaetia bacterium]|nr:hypothetical protein [Spirochaetia bacterium]